MTSSQTFLAQVTQILVERLSIEEAEITPTATLRDDLGMDSLDALEFAAAIEESYAIALSDDDIRSLVTVSDAVVLLEQKLAQPEAS